jgi:hypothetical protein
MRLHGPVCPSQHQQADVLVTALEDELGVELAARIPCAPV